MSMATRLRANASSTVKRVVAHSPHATAAAAASHLGAHLLNATARLSHAASHHGGGNVHSVPHSVPPAGSTPLLGAEISEETAQETLRLGLLTLTAAHMAPVLIACALLVIRKSSFGGSQSATRIFQGALVLTFLCLNSGLSVLNRWALGVHGFSFPLALTSIHMLFGSCALSPFMLLAEQYANDHGPILRENWRTLALIGSLNGLQIACNNASLTKIELSLNQGACTRASNPCMRHHSSRHSQAHRVRSPRRTWQSSALSARWSSPSSPSA